MSDQSRSLPDRPSLRYLKLEARRRHAAGEFPTLHEAQLAIAREHGQSSWTVLKELIGDRQPDPEGAALEHVRWVTSRFAGASQPDWSPPGAEELRGHFEEPFLDRVTPARLVSTLSSLARDGRLRDEVTVLAERRGRGGHRRPRGRAADRWGGRGARGSGCRGGRGIRRARLARAGPGRER
jgi:hypothetical protein